MTVPHLADLLAVSTAEVVLQLYKKGVKAVLTSVLDADAVRLVAEVCNACVTVRGFACVHARLCVRAWE